MNVARKRIELQMRCVVLMILLPALVAAAEWQPDPADRRQVKAHEGVERIKERLPDTAPYFEQAHAYAIIPSITRVAIGFGGAYGRGIVVEDNTAVGRTSYFQFSSGIQLGAKYFTMIIFFKDAESLNEYKKSQWQFTGQAGIDLVTVGLSGTPAFSSGVAIFAVTRLGLMGEFSYSGARFGYTPFTTDE